ncbi:MAG: hypothetical protein ACRERY_01690 [Pseudomonas sp.]
MNTLLKYSLILAGFACSTGNIFAEESQGNYMRLEQLVYSQQNSADSGERFAKVLEKQPTAAGPQQAQERGASAPVPRALSAPRQQGHPEQGDIAP